MRTEYWYTARNLMRKYGFSKLKSKSFAWKLKHLAEDLVTFENPTQEAMHKAIVGEIEAYKNLGIVLNETNSIGGELR